MAVSVGDVDRRDRLGDVDLAVSGGALRLGGLVGDGLEDDLVEVGLAVGVPVVGVLVDRDVVAGRSTP